MQTKEYNGYTNYETWVVALWIDNDQGSSEFWNEQAEYWLGRAKDEDDAKCRLSEALKAEHEENAPELNGAFADLLNAALSEVDWYDIAENLITTAKENVA